MLLFPNRVHRLPWGLHGKESACQYRRCRFDPWVRKIPWRRKQQPTPLFLPGKSQGQRSLVGYSPRSRKELDTTEQLNNNNNEHVHLITSVPLYSNCIAAYGHLTESYDPKIAYRKFSNIKEIPMTQRG